MEHKLSNLKKLQQISLSDEERAYLRGRLAQTVLAPVPAREALFARGVQHSLRIALSSFLFVVFVGGSMSAIASNALPGDPLYTMKTEFNEVVAARLRKTPEEKVAYAQNRVSTRVQEIKTLAQTKTLTKEKQAIAQKALDVNIQDLSTQLNTLSDQSPSTALSVTANLEQNLKQDKEAIQNTLGADVSTDPTAAATMQTIDGTLKKVSQQEVKILSKEIDNISTEVNATNTDTSATTVDPNAKTDTKTTTGTTTPATDTKTNTNTTTDTTTKDTTTPPSPTPVSP